jgi:hypothetical protein
MLGLKSEEWAKKEGMKKETRRKRLLNNTKVPSTLGSKQKKENR